MKFSDPSAEIFVPDAVDETQAFPRISHLGIMAHQDDLEFHAFHGILACHQSDTDWFGGVTCTNGSGSARAGRYAQFTDEQMAGVRRQEQNRAAEIGHYGVMVQLGHPSAVVKDAANTALRDDLVEILRATRPRVVYTHNLADKHDTHVAVCVATIQAIRLLPPNERPGAVYGCEGWRNLDWMGDGEKVMHDISGHDALATELNTVFDSQIAGGKRYDLGIMGRRRANATFFESHAVDRTESAAFEMDLTPLVKDESLDMAEYVDGIIARFRDDVRARVRARLGL